MNILVVDDYPSVRAMLEASLTNLGYRVSTAANGHEALRFFDKSHIPLVISDLLMPGMDGLELCRRIRNANRAQYTYIILLTAVEGKRGYLDGMNAGADDFLNKPFDEDMIAARLVVAERILKLQSQVKHLAGLLPMCSRCKKIRDDKNYWHQVESYIAQHSDVTFTHSYCPNCAQELMNDLKRIQERQGA